MSKLLDSLAELGEILNIDEALNQIEVVEELRLPNPSGVDKLPATNQAMCGSNSPSCQGTCGASCNGSCLPKCP